MKRLKLIQIAVLMGIIVMAGGMAGCGGGTKSSCDCAICINDQPLYPCDSEASCADFAASQGCTSYEYVNSSTETCGGNPQPVCRASNCSGECRCPGE